MGKICTAKICEDSVVCGDSVELIKFVQAESVHLILSDIPYGIGAEDWDVLHDNTNKAYLGSSPAQKKAGDVFKRRGKPINGWSVSDRNISKEYQDWCSKWSYDWYRVLKPGASAIIFCGRRFSHRCTQAMEDIGFNLKDILAWMKAQAPHRAQRLSTVYERRGDIVSSRKWEGWRLGNLQPTFEPVLWFVKPYKIGTTIADNVLKHEVGAYNQKAFLKYNEEPENIMKCTFGKSEKGLHDTQKPVHLMQALIDLTTKTGQVVLDPFAGSGTTLVAAKKLGRRYIGFDQDEKCVKICKDRLAPDLFS